MISTLAFAIRICLLALLTYVFIVLIEHGPKGFPRGFTTEASSLAEFAKSIGKSPPIMALPQGAQPAEPQASPTNAGSTGSVEASPSPPPEIKGLERWRKIQERRIGEGGTIDDPVQTESP